MEKPDNRNTPAEQKTGVKFVNISADQAGQRIDNFLLTRLKGAPKSLIYRILRKGEVRVNKGRIKPPYKLQAGDEVRIPPVRLSAKPAARPSRSAIEVIAENILYEDKRLLVLNKPSGFAVHGGSGLSYGVIEALRTLFPKAPYLELVHRLDRDTSGCLLIAKKRSMLRFLHEQLREHRLHKQYLTLVKGLWPGGKQTINLPLRKNTLRSGERLVRVDDSGKVAISHFKPRTTSGLASLIEVDLETGRTHQIRVHAAYSGHPIAGDEKYGEADFNQKMRNYGLKRLFLHASNIAFLLSPDSEESIKIEAPLEASLQNTLKQLDLIK
ncbi:Ribosomal large subunit pseudouridine synthase C [hydrothermal vent metagenome]|uniref:Ribosomal large subunit pseudouridine synthase C n=1 Tax=hydrothermal vent metagenome TaxID=652676 RepID=A0A3B1BDT4_9ZZZZ